ncbi:dehydrogenase/reductase [Luminiphilus syltensis NOR5-1B]|uniref:Dehydrogenase/reductase n=1 Tax=Luminiphilus syltensis NOR5-1B TaxID=565045 RepID=B8KYC0_9GAMM|nr:SDR family NAD(P)-dependent oxidoreductase [Luminiphilus syltensis]EED36928.1 dehydrogenase/reductase [Luminiphilus syltensis NOR5-1B]
MITLHEEAVVPRSARECFRYVADFRTTVEWDATAVLACKTSPGPVAKGTEFEVHCKAGPTTLKLTYEIIEYEPWHCLVLRGRGRLFDVTDTILFTERDDGTHISYTAEFQFSGALSPLLSAMEPGLHSMGKTSVEGLAQALTDANPLPESRPATQRADNWVVPGLAMFSKYGFRRGRRHWHPMSTSMKNKHVVITGATSGLGKAAAIALAEAEADLTLVIRDKKKGEQLRQDIAAETGWEQISLEIADLSLVSEVDALVERLRAKDRPIDVLINNAGALFGEYDVTSEGLERSFALLLMSPWRLTEGLHPLLAGHEQPARVINVVSGGMYTERLECDQLVMTPEHYNGPKAYARAKRGLTVLTEQWADAWATDGIVVNAMHPGWADTPGIGSALPTFHKITRSILRTPEEGADSIIWLARAREADTTTGKLFLDREIRTPYLLEKTRESKDERIKLPAFLSALYEQSKTEGQQAA